MATKARHLKTPLQLWIADQRKAHGLTPGDLAALTGVSEDTARGWESRGRPSEDAIAVLERRSGTYLLHPILGPAAPLIAFAVRRFY